VRVFTVALWGILGLPVHAETTGGEKKPQAHDLSQITVMVIVFFPIYPRSAPGRTVLPKDPRVGAVP